ncbi:hypothetical protein SAMN06265350_106235 [Solitalea koreensis]|uniref:Natural product n=1 Tax=Solitalea koreensis TaxID=543615 RepID=A0A521DEF7_9SPHI|nr:hypothetical protein SAMN06265350_106235 [Solitalea koreensis]
MKKLSLKKLSLEDLEVLSREQLKFVLGGGGSDGECRALYANESCSNGMLCVDANGHCSNCCVA